jgi:hypothetical protein
MSPTSAVGLTHHRAERVAAAPPWALTEQRQKPTVSRARASTLSR